MFQKRNRTLLLPKNGNEYFIDRSGQIFHYIMQYYRTGKISIASQGKLYIDILVLTLKISKLKNTYIYIYYYILF